MKIALINRREEFSEWWEKTSLGGPCAKLRKSKQDEDKGKFIGFGNEVINGSLGGERFIGRLLLWFNQIEETSGCS